MVRRKLIVGVVVGWILGVFVAVLGAMAPPGASLALPSCVLGHRVPLSGPPPQPCAARR